MGADPAGGPIVEPANPELAAETRQRFADRFIAVASDHAGTPAAVRGLVAMLRIGYAVLRDIATGQLTLRAMGLVYVTLLSIVPLIALSFSPCAILSSGSQSGNVTESE